MRKLTSLTSGSAALCALLVWAGPAQATEDHPDAATIVAASVEAVGGREAYNKVESLHAKGRAVLPGMGEMTMDIRHDRKGRFSLTQEIPGMGSMQMASDGRYGWMQNPMTGQWELMDEMMMQASRQQADFFRMLVPAEEEIGRMETVGRAERNGRPHWQVRMTDEDGTVQMVFFDVETKRLARVESEQDMGMGPMRMTMVFGDWKKVGDLHFFHKVEVDQGMGMNVTLEFREITLNTLEDKDFTPPGPIAEQIRQREAARKAAEEAAGEKP